MKAEKLNEERRNDCLSGVSGLPCQLLSPRKVDEKFRATLPEIQREILEGFQKWQWENAHRHEVEVWQSNLELLLKEIDAYLAETKRGKT